MIANPTSYAFGTVKKALSLLVLLALVSSSFVALPPLRAFAQTRVLQIAYTPTKRAQIAVWLETATGTFVRTIMLTEAVGLRGIGNRPGALQMNSGFRWPYGRREGVLPIWAYRRAAAPGAQPFPRVIFQNRVEGKASQTASDNSPDPFYCLSFNDLQNDNVDTVTCASVFNSDKGAYITAARVQANYAEPYEFTLGTSGQRPLSLTSLYPMRRDIAGGVQFDTQDTRHFADDVRAIMPDIDAVTRATAPADTPQLLTFTLPDGMVNGDYVVYLEVNTERDLNDTWTEAAHPTPTVDTVNWDSWSAYGYAYRGQPSILYQVPIHLDGASGNWTVGSASGYGELEGLDGMVRAIDATITDDTAGHPGSGVDRLRANGGVRVSVSTDAIAACSILPVVPPIGAFTADHVADEDHSNEWASLSFTAVAVDGADASNYQVKVSHSPITNETEFMQAEDAKAATSEIQGLNLCPVDMMSGSSDCPAAGTTVNVDIGRLTFLTHYYVAIRATGPCGTVGPITSAEFETTAINFTTVAPCFVATAAHGSPMAADVQTLRAFRNERLMTNAPGRAFVRAYYALGPALASVIAENDTLRAVARALLRPFVQASAR